MTTVHTSTLKYPFITSVFHICKIFWLQRLSKLKDRQSKNSAQRLEAEIKLATEEIEKKAEKEVAMIRAKASVEAAEIYSKADGEVAKARAKAKEDVQKLEKHGRLVKK